MTSLFSAYWPWIVAAVIALALLILAALTLLLRKAAKVTEISNPPEEEEEEEKKTEAAPAAPSKDYARIKSAFRAARQALSQRGDSDRYATPLVLLLGAEGSRDPGFLRQTAGAGLELFGDPVKEGLAFAEGREFLFFDKGVVLDVAGEPVLGSGGKHADDGAWRDIMRNLVEIRPKRPVDGLVVTVSCIELKQAAQDETLRLALAETAARVRGRLWNVQEKTGFRLPLYVLVTNCEVLEGFAQTVTALPKTDRGQMLGWSSPYGAHVPYQSVWIDRTFTSVREALCDLQMALFSKGGQDAKVMLFPWSFDPIAEPLRTFLDQLLSPGARHEGAITRGIYFCGEATKPPTVFAADLFARKIFPEAGLATPTSAVRMTRSRKAKAVHWATAAAAILMIAGLGLAAWLLSERHGKILALLNESQGDLVEIRNGNMSGGTLNDAAAQTLGRVAEIDFDDYGPWWLPSTWFSSFDHDLDAVIARSFETIVLKAIHENLESHATSLIREATGHIVASDAPGEVDDAVINDTVIEPVEKTAEFIRLRTFVTEIRKVEQQGALFNRVATFGEGDVDALKTLIKETLNQPLPERFERERAAYQRAVKAFVSDARFVPKTYATDASFAAKQQAAALYARLFGKNASALRVKRLAQALDPASLNAFGRAEVNVESFRWLDNTITALQGDLSTPATEWEFRPTFDLGPEFTNVVAMIEQSQMFEPDTAKQIRADGRDGLRRLQQELAARTGLGFSVLKLRTDGSPSNELSHMTEVMQTAVKSFLGEKFVVAETPPSSTPLYEAGKRLVWDGGQLDQSTAVFAAYKEFHETGLKKFPGAFAATIDDAAQQHTVTRMAGFLANARRFEPITRAVTPAGREENVRLAAAAFEAASKPVHAQLAALRALKNSGSAVREVIDASSFEAVRMLRSVDELLNDSAPYAPSSSSFDWWDGSTPPAPAAWGAHDAGELAEYLDTMRAHIGAMSDSYAAPALIWFAEFGAPSNPDDAALVKRWRSISTDLHNFAAKKAGNTPALLDDYIAVRAAKVTPADCREAEIRPAERAANGYFAERLKSISSEVYARCRVVAVNKAADRYNELARLFNQRLAGRYPFSTKLRLGDVEADPEDVRRFYASFDDSKTLFAAVPENGAPGWFAPARKFIDEMTSVRLFFAAFLDPKKLMRLPEVDVETQFRVIEEREVGANQIINWSLNIGGDVSTSRDKKKLAWHPGTPVLLKLRWAADAPRVPVPMPDQRNVFINDREVVFEYANRWSLLSALAELRASSNDLPGGADQQPFTLALNVLTKPAAGGEPDPRHPSILFLRLSLSGSDGQPLELPTFPPTAPPLKRLVAEESTP
jgi:type VI secretion system protein ImpL